MPTGQNHSNLLQEQAHRTLAPHLSAIAESLSALKEQLSSSCADIDRKLQVMQALEFTQESAIVSEAVEGLRRGRGEALRTIARFAAEVRRKETQEEILNFLLDESHRFGRHGVLFVLRGNELIGWSSRGYPEEAAQEIRRSSIPLAGSRLLRDALQFSGLSRFGDIRLEYELGRLLQPEGSEVWFACPLKALQRPVALLLASTEAEDQSDSDVVAALTELTGLCVENIALRIMQETAAAEAASRPAPAPHTAFQAPATGEDLPIESAAPEVFDAAVESDSPELEPFGSMADASPSPAPAAGSPEDETAGAMSVSQPVQAPASPPPPVVTPKAVEFVSEEEKLHTEAKRFARLLVSEIKLYNEQRVLEGRENRDVYVRLKRDIDRSRDMYEKRVSPTVSRKIDYFHDEVIRILGENDPSSLGSDYPGPRVES